METTISILVVDDEETAGQYLRRLLIKDGFAARTTTRPERTLSLLKRNSYDVVLVDMVMPNLSGEELTAKIKKSFPFLTVIGVTAKSGLTDRIKAMEEGVDDFYTKPYEVKDLSNSIRASVPLKKKEEIRNRITPLLRHEPEATVGQVIEVIANEKGLPELFSAAKRTAEMKVLDPAARRFVARFDGMLGEAREKLSEDISWDAFLSGIARELRQVLGEDPADEITQTEREDRLLQQLMEIASELHKATDDVDAAMVAYAQFRSVLNNLWSEHHPKDDIFAQILTLIEDGLYNKPLSQLTSEKWNAIKKVLDILQKDGLSVKDAMQCDKALRKAGLETIPSDDLLAEA